MTFGHVQVPFFLEEEEVPKEQIGVGGVVLRTKDLGKCTTLPGGRENALVVQRAGIVQGRPHLTRGATCSHLFIPVGRVHQMAQS